MTSKESFSMQVGKLLVFGLILPCLLIIIPAIVAYRSQRELTESFRWVSHTIEVQHQLQRFLSLLDDAETGQRGYLLTSRDIYLEPYQSALASLPNQTATIRSLTADNPVQQEHFRQIAALMAAKLAEVARTISFHQHGDTATALLLVNSDQGKQAMDAIRATIKLMEQEESRLLLARQQRLSSHARFGTGLVAALVALDLLFAVAVFVLFRRLANVQGLVTVCAWSRTIEYQGDWLSFEEYLLRRFNLNTSHGISPSEAKKAFGELQHKQNDA